MLVLVAQCTIYTTQVFPESLSLLHSPIVSEGGLLIINQRTIYNLSQVNASEPGFVLDRHHRVNQTTATTLCDASVFSSKRSECSNYCFYTALHTRSTTILAETLRRCNINVCLFVNFIQNKVVAPQISLEFNNIVFQLRYLEMPKT